MRDFCREAFAAAMLLGIAVSPASAGSDYQLTVDILGEDGGVTFHQQLTCPRYQPCVANFPATIQGTALTVYMKAQVHDDRQIGVMIFPPNSTRSSDGKPIENPFDLFSTSEAFDVGNEWTIELKKTVVVPIDPSKQKFKWITTELNYRTMLKLRMRLDG